MDRFELRLPVHATPGAKRTEVAGSRGEVLRVRLAAPPVDGKANAALIAWAAQAFDVPRHQVQLLHGATGRRKLLSIALDSAQTLAQAQAQVVRWKAAALAGEGPNPT